MKEEGGAPTLPGLISQKKEEFFGKTVLPLPERVRPTHLDEVVGHKDLVGEGGIFRKFLEEKYIPHLILWGPPGTGKTTIARILARGISAYYEWHTGSQFTVAIAREIFETAHKRYRYEGKRTVLFLDEIHRFTRDRQDLFLKELEEGPLILMGATTLNPSFYLTPAILSRVQVFYLNPLKDEDILISLKKALIHPDGIQKGVEEEVLLRIARRSQGDLRTAYLILETVANVSKNNPVTLEDYLHWEKKAFLFRHDREGDLHYDVVSAWIKSMRAGDIDASLYWGARLWIGGEDRAYLFRRMIIFASEDIGMADPDAVPRIVALASGYDRVGEKEGWILFAQGIVYLAGSPKSKSSYKAFQKALDFVEETGVHPVPFSLRNAPTPLMKEMGYGKGYRDPHEHPEGYLPGERYFPEDLSESRFYEPTSHGFEKNLKDRWEKFLKEREKERGK